MLNTAGTVVERWGIDPMRRKTYAMTMLTAVALTVAGPGGCRSEPSVDRAIPVQAEVEPAWVLARLFEALPPTDPPAELSLLELVYQTDLPMASDGYVYQFWGNPGGRWLWLRRVGGFGGFVAWAGPVDRYDPLIRQLIGGSELRGAGQLVSK